MIAKKQAKREQTHPVCLHAVEKYKKVNTQNDYQKTSEETKHNTNIKRKQTYSVGFVNSKKTSSRSFKRISRKK